MRIVIAPLVAPPGPARGILRPNAVDASDTLGGHERLAAAPALRGLVEHYWFVWWDRRGAPARQAETLPHPSVHIVARDGEVRAHGIMRGRFTTTLAGLGRAVGIKFRPGGFAPYYGRPVSALAGRSTTLDDVFGADGDALASIMLSTDANALPAAIVERLDAFLVARLPAPDPNVDVVAAIVAEIAADRTIARVEDVATRSGLGARALQRLFSRYVGATPKWVIQRYRLHEAAERLAAGDVTDWTTLALDLGYCDQAHFINDFRRLVGCPPARYAERVRQLG